MGASKATGARQLALEVTCDVRKRDAYVRELLDARRPTNTLPDEEFAYAQVLSFGVVMCRGTLDEAIDRSLRSPRDVKPNVRDALRISAYELLFLHKPDHVVVDQGVELARTVTPRAAGLANAVLRKMVQDAQSFPWGDPDADQAAFARLYGVPSWIADALIERLGHEGAASVLATSLEPAPTYTVENPFAPETVFVSDLSAQFVASLVPTDGSILEVGAGRGTKTLLMQAAALRRSGPAADIHTVDVHAYKEDILRERMEQMQVPGVTTHTGDARKLASIADLPASFDAALVDAPCSGLGTLRRHPEIRWRLQPADVDELATLQLELLCSAAGRVAEGGTLVYATCTLLAQENEQVVKAFLDSAEGSGFSVAPPCAIPDRPGWHLTPEGFFSSVPTSGGPDGHFAAVLVRGRTRQ